MQKVPSSPPRCWGWFCHASYASRARVASASCSPEMEVGGGNKDSWCCYWKEKGELERVRESLGVVLTGMNPVWTSANSKLLWVASLFRKSMLVLTPATCNQREGERERERVLWQHMYKTNTWYCASEFFSCCRALRRSLFHTTSLAIMGS